MGARDPKKAEGRIQEIRSKSPKGTLSHVQLDVNSDDSITTAVKQIEQDFGRIDILINNAGIYPEPAHTLWPNRDQLRAAFETNVYGPVILTAAAVPLLKASSSPKIINVTSSLGCINTYTDNLQPPSEVTNYRDIQGLAYRMSKTALNMSSVYQNYYLKDIKAKVWSYCPGYVITDLGGQRDRKVEEPWCESSETSAQGILDIVEGKRDGETGGFVTRRGGSYPW